METTGTIRDGLQPASAFMAPSRQNDAEVERRVSELRRGIKVEENFRWLFTHFSGGVFHFFAKRGLPADRCEDLTQEVFLRVYRSIGRFRGDSKFSTWLFRIAWNLGMKELRSTITDRHAYAGSLEEMVEPDGALSGAAEAAAEGESNDPLRNALLAERRVLLHQELERMPPQMRRCILLRVDRGLKYREIATLMQISIDTVKSQLHQAKDRLVDRLRGGPKEKR